MGRDAVVNAAASYVGTPFQHQGRLPGVGLDCVGLVLCAFWESGYQPHEYQRYGRIPHPRVMRRELLKECDEVKAPWTPGDILWFRIRSYPQHLALWTGKDMIHAFEKLGAVRRQPIDASWTAYLETVLRYRGLDE